MSAKAEFGGALRSELTKIRSVRSTYWALATTVLITVLIGVLICAFVLGASSGPRSSNYDPTHLSLVGLVMGQLIIAVLGALTVTSEYATGIIRTSLTVQPRRVALFAAKATALTPARAAGCRRRGTVPVRVRAARIRAGRPTALHGGAVAAAVALLFASAAMPSFLPGSWQESVSKWIPFNAGSQMWSTVSNPAAHMLSPWAGFAVFAGYAAIALAAGLVAFLRRDA